MHIADLFGPSGFGKPGRRSMPNRICSQAINMRQDEMESQIPRLSDKRRLEHLCSLNVLLILPYIGLDSSSPSPPQSRYSTEFRAQEDHDFFPRWIKSEEQTLELGFRPCTTAKLLSAGAMTCRSLVKEAVLLAS